MSEQAVAFRCVNCGAPLEVTPETIVAVCPYCGTPNWTAQAYVYPIVLVPARSREARNLFLKWMESDPDLRKLRGKKEIKGVEIVYVPTYIADTNARSRYAGTAVVTVTKTRVVKKGGQTTVETMTRNITVYVSGSLEKSYTIPIVARRNYDATTVDPLLEYFLKTKPAFRPISEVDWGEVKGSILAAEIDSNTAGKIARDESCDRLHREAEQAMEEAARRRAMAEAPGWIPTTVVWTSRRISCRSTVSSLSPLILVPAIVGWYSYRRSIYRAVLAGWDGMKVYSEEPISTSERLLYYIGAIGASGLIGGGGLAAALAKWGSLAVALIAFLLGAGGAYYLTSKAISDVKIEGIGE